MPADEIIGKPSRQERHRMIAIQRRFIEAPQRSAFVHTASAHASSQFRAISARRFRALLLLAWLPVAALHTCASPAFTADEKPRELPAYQLQPGDTPALPLDPVKKRTPEEQRKLDAVAWYMTGNFHASRGDFKQAMDAFQAAVQLDPEAVAAYQALVPLAFSANRAQEAIDYATKAFRLDPENHSLLRLLAAHMIRQNKLDDAIDLLEKSLKSQPIPRESAANVNLNWDLARYYRAAGKNDEAAKSFEIVLEAALDPAKFGIDDRTQAALQADKNYEALGEAFLDAGRTELAIQAFRQVSEARNGRPGVLNLHLAQAYRQTERYDDALHELEIFFGTQIPRRDAYELLAGLLEQQGKSDELLPRLEKLAEHDARNAVLKFYLAEQYALAKRYEDAEKLYKSTLDGSSQPEGYVGLAAVYRAQERAADWLEAISKPFADAISDATGTLPDVVVDEMRIVTEQPEFLKLVLASGTEQSEAQPPTLSFATAYLLGKLASEVDDKEATQRFYRFAIASRGGNPTVLYQELSDWLMLHDHYSEAAAVLQDAVDDPALAAQRPVFLFFLARAREFNGETKAALVANEEARRARPDVPQFQFQHGWIYYHSHQWDEAITAMKKVMADFPDNKDLVRQCQFSISNIYVQQGDIGKGEEILEEVLAEDPEDPSVNNDLGYLYADQGKNLEQAESMIRKALKAEPENAAYLDSMGWVLFKLGRVDEAVPYLEQAASQPSGADPTILEHLGDCYDRQGKHEKARETWSKGLEKARADSRPDVKIIERLSSKLKPAKTSDPTE